MGMATATDMVTATEILIRRVTRYGYINPILLILNEEGMLFQLNILSLSENYGREENN